MNTRIGLMVKKFNLLKIGYDFMGYSFHNKKELSYHHLIVPKIISNEQGYGNGIEEWNGAILTKKTSHAYLHLIELYDYDCFLSLTSEMLDQIFKGYLDEENLYYINEILNSFEREYQNVTNCKGKPIIKEEYQRRLYKKR